ncbi:preprotein translocase subunit SecF [Afipia massiliensis]|uniref:Preprotein translocase subunit SecF n=1 Tax=Afipia massiliensis TaxID=211460 RepID=A0A840N792_9BRAD|nr:hypothetical protein [Afipia massiliensis]MBB5054722.1 preprotein translocase subunit SecF [Afipia massiliensis]
MVLRFIAFALTLLLLTPGSVLSVMADDVGLSAAERAKNIKASEARKAQGQATDTSRDVRAMKYHRMGQQPPQAQKQHSMGQQPPRAQKQQQRRQQQEQQAMQQAKRCQDAINDAQNTAVGTSVLSSAVGFLPFGGTASGVAGAAAGMGATVGGEITRQKAAAAVQGNC